MSSEQEAVLDSLDEIINDYDENGVLDVTLANEFIDKLNNLYVDGKDINDVAKTFLDIYNGNNHIQHDDDMPAESVEKDLFDGLRRMLSALNCFGKNSSMTTTQSVKSNLRVESRPDGTKVLTWDYLKTKTTAPTQKVPEPSQEEPQPPMQPQIE